MMLDPILVVACCAGLGLTLSYFTLGQSRVPPLPSNSSLSIDEGKVFYHLLYEKCKFIYILMELIKSIIYQMTTKTNSMPMFRKNAWINQREDEYF